MKRRTCFHEGCEAPAPWGLRLPGLLSEVPEKYRGYLWHCRAHEAEALARRDAALAKAKADGSLKPRQIGMNEWLMEAGNG